MALIAIFAAQILLETSFKSPSSDEPPHIASGLSYVSTGIFRGNPQHPPLLKELSGLSMILGGIRWPRNPDTDRFLHGDYPAGEQPEWLIGSGIIDEFGPDRVLFWARLPLVLVSCLLAALIYLWGRQMVGPAAALGGVILCTLDPVILGQSGFVTMDIGVAAFLMLFFFVLWNYVKNPTIARLVLTGLALGAALGAKFSAGLAIPVAGILMLAAIVWPAPGTRNRKRTPLDPFVPETIEPSAAASSRDFFVAARKAAKTSRNQACPCGSGKKFKACHGALPRTPGAGLESPELIRRLGLCAIAFLAICAIAFVFIQALYFFPSDLLAYYRGMKLVNADHNANYQVFLAGNFQSRFVTYFAAAYLLKEPIAGIILTGIGGVALIRSRSISRLGKLFLVLPPVAWFIGHTFLADDLGIRYILAVFPFVHLVGGLGIATLWGMKAKWGRYLAGALCAWLVLADAGVYPDHLSYLNETACLFENPSDIGLDGGTRCGPFWLDDSNVDWGQGLKQLRTWLDHNAQGRKIRILSTFGFPPEIYKIPTEESTGRDYTVPSTGLYAVSAHLVARLRASPNPTWLKTTKPKTIVGHAFYIYDLP